MSGRGNAAPPSPDIEQLSGWVTSGGGWVVVGRTPERLTVALLTCDGGQEMDRITSTDPAFAAYVDDLVGSARFGVDPRG